MESKTINNNVNAIKDVRELLTSLEVIFLVKNKDNKKRTL